MENPTLLFHYDKVIESYKLLKRPFQITIFKSPRMTLCSISRFIYFIEEIILCMLLQKHQNSERSSLFSLFSE